MTGARIAMSRTQRLAVTLIVAAGCQSSPGTSVQVSLQYDDKLGLDTAEVTVGNRTESARIQHRLLLLLPDELAGAEVPLEVWGRDGGKRAAYGTGSVVPRRGETVTASLTLGACSPGCLDTVLHLCAGQTVECVLGCTDDADARCSAPTPSNGVDANLATQLRGVTRIAADTTFDVDSGEITGGVTRAAGPGIEDGIGYYQLTGLSGGVPLGVFVFHDLTVDAAATVRFTGARAVVWLVGNAARIAGTLEVSAGQGAREAPGPGGGAGGTAAAPAQGCGAGGAGLRGAPTTNEDSGGGGGGAGAPGGIGGVGSTPTPPSSTPGGAAGTMCVAARLEPLVGGSGGGAGSPGETTMTPSGGGGGGALQLTALGSLEITGIIHAGGAGGDVGSTAAVNAGAGAGGGSGGAILLEAPAVTIGASAIVAANGGGGGGGGSEVLGTPGQNARASLVAAAGGIAGEVGGTQGGAGGTATTSALAGASGASNGAGGGGGVGAIAVRGRVRTLGGTITPAALQVDL
jgi:hypothetical protein